MEMNEVFECIKRAEGDEIEALFEAILQRKREVYPDWKIMYYAMPKLEWEKQRWFWKLALESLSEEEEAEAEDKCRMQ